MSAATPKARAGFEALLGSAAPGLAPAGRALRRAILSLHPGATETLWPRQRIASFGAGPRKMSEHCAYIGFHAAHVNLGFYHGAALADPSGLLVGTGKRLRHVPVRTAAEAGSPALKALLREALRDRERALEPTP